MAGVLSLDFQSNLLSLLEKSNKSMAKIENTLERTQNAFLDMGKKTNDYLTNNNKVLTKSSDIYVENNKSLEKAVDYYNDIEKSSKGLLENSKLLESFTSGFKGALGAIFGGFAALMPATLITDAIRMNLKYEQSFLDLSYRMGQGRKAASQYTSAMHDITQSTGIANETSMELINELAKFRVVPKDMADLGKATARFSEITGLSKGESAQLAGNLMRVGRIGKESTKSVMLGMAQVQRAVGLTDSEMSELSSNIVMNTRLLSNMGKSGAEIERFSKTTANLSGAFVKVGLTISDAQDLLDRFLDPSKFEDNALLYAQLGYSLSDVMSGAIPEEEIQGRLKELGGRVKDMGMAGVDLAKNLGIGYKELVKMGDVSVDPLEGQEKTAETTEQALKRMQEEQLGVSKKLEQTVNILSDKMSQAFDKVMPALNRMGNWMRSFAQKIKMGALVLYAFLAFGGLNLFKKLWHSFTDGSRRASVDTSKNLSKGFQTPINNMTNSVSSALSMGYKKAADKIAAQKEIKMRVREEIQAERREGGTDYAKRAQAAEFIYTRMQMSQSKFSRGMLANTEAWLIGIQKGAKMSSYFEYATAKNNERVKERIALVERDKQLSKDSYDILLGSAKERQAEIKQRLDSLGVSIKNNQIQTEGLNLTDRQKSELKLLDAERIKNQTFIRNEYIKQSKEQQRFDDVRLKQLKMLSATELYNLAEQHKQKALNIAQDLSSIQINKQDLTIEKEALETMKKKVDQEVAGLLKEKEDAKTRGGLNAEKSKQLLEQLKLQKEYAASQASVTSRLNEELEREKQLTEESNKQQKLEKEAAGLADKKGKGAVGEITNKPLYKAADYFGSVFRRAGSAFIDVGERVKTGIVNGAKAIGEKLNPKNIAAAVKTVGLKNLIFGGDYKTINKQGEEQVKHTKGLIGALGKTVLGVGVLAGSMGLLNFFMKPLMEVMRPLLDVFNTAIKDLVKQLMPAMLQLFIGLIPMFEVAVEMLLPFLLKVLSGAITIITFLINTIADAILFLRKLPMEIGIKIADAIPGGKSTERSLEDILGKEKYKKVSEGKTQEQLQEMLLEEKMKNTAAFKIADGLKQFSGGLKKVQSAVEGIEIDIDGDKLVKDLTEASKQQTTAQPEAAVTTPAGSPTVYATSKEGFKKTDEGSVSAEDNTAKAAQASEKTAENVNTVAKNQEVQVSIEAEQLSEMKKLNNNLKLFLTKVNITPATGVL
jgi:hypothetical protein